MASGKLRRERTPVGSISAWELEPATESCETRFWKRCSIAIFGCGTGALLRQDHVTSLTADSSFVQQRN